MAGVSRKFCEHCEEMLAPRTFREHLRLYYDGESHTWRKRMKRSDTTGPLSAHESCSNQDLLEPDEACTLGVGYSATNAMNMIITAVPIVLCRINQ